MIVYLAIMVDRLVENRCPFLKGDNGVSCSTTKALPAAKSYITAELKEEVTAKDVRDLLCNIGGNDCPIRSDLDLAGIRSMYARPI